MSTTCPYTVIMLRPLTQMLTKIPTTEIKTLVPSMDLNSRCLILITTMSYLKLHPELTHSSLQRRLPCRECKRDQCQIHKTLKTARGMAIIEYVESRSLKTLRLDPSTVSEVEIAVSARAMAVLVIRPTSTLRWTS